MYDKCQTLYDSSPHWAVPFTFLSTTCVCRSCWRWCIQNHPIPSSVMSTITLVNAHHLFLSFSYSLTCTCTVEVVCGCAKTLDLGLKGCRFESQSSQQHPLPSSCPTVIDSIFQMRPQFWIPIQSAASSPLLLSYGYTLNLSDETTKQKQTSRFCVLYMCS